MRETYIYSEYAMKVILAEKKDQAKKIGQFMGFSDKKSYWEGQIEGEQARIVWAAGHLVRLRNPDEMVEGLNWNSLEGLTPIPKDYSLIPLDDNPNMPAGAQPRAYLKRIKEQLKDCSEVILSTDADREGETLGWMILEFLGYTGPVRRAWLAGGLDRKTITEAFKNLRPASRTRSWGRGGEARGRSDRAYMFLVRAYTYYARYGVFGRNLGEGKGRGGVMGMGRVQTPTLNMVVRREDEIENFVPVNHYKFLGHFTAEGATGSVEASYIPRVTEEVIEAQPEGVHWEPSKEPPNAQGKTPLDKPLFVDKNRVDQFVKALTDNADNAKVVKYVEGTSEKKPPKTYALADAQGDIGRKLKIDGDLVQTILEDLYEQGWISYARTSKADLPASVYEASERDQYFKAVLEIPNLSAQAQRVMDIHDGKDSQYKPFKPSVLTTKDLEHHGMMPTSQRMTKSTFESLRPKKSNGKKGVQHTTKNMQDAYVLVAQRFIQAFYPPAKYATQEITFSVPVQDLLNAEDSLFKARAQRQEDPGWKDAFGADSDAEASLPSLNDGDPAKLLKVDTKDSVTRPPIRYTTTSLPQAMENISREIRDPDLRKRMKVAEGIGTPATRKNIIETLIARNYMEQDKKKNLRPTQRGRDLIKSVPNWLSSPETTAVWEDYLSQICEIKDDDEKTIEMRDLFVNKQIEKIERLIQKLQETYNGKLGERIGGGGSVSPKMKKAIEMVCQRIGQKPDKEILSNFDKAKEFLDKYMGENAKPLPPSPKQLDYGKKVFDATPEKDRPDWEKISVDGKGMAKFIDENKKHLDKVADASPPTAAQLSFAKKLAAKLDPKDQPDPKVFETRKGCSKFIDEQTKDWDKSGKKKASGGGRKKPAKKAS